MAKGADCKSAGLRLRRFESYLSHQSSRVSRATTWQAKEIARRRAGSMTYAFLKYFHIIDAIPTYRKLSLNRTLGG